MAFTASRRLRIGDFSSLDLEQEISAGGELLWSAKQRLVAVMVETENSCAWPDDIRAALDGYLEDRNA